MAEVMSSQYIRTARLKGLSFRQVVMKHALRNALIAPFTVIMLQFPWLLSGVVVVEAIFRYQGFGFLLVSAASNNDIDLILACGLFSVVVVLRHAADFGHRLCLAQPAHPDELRESHMENVGTTRHHLRHHLPLLARVAGAGRAARRSPSSTAASWGSTATSSARAWVLRAW